MKALIWTFFIIVVLNIIIYLLYTNNFFLGNIRSINDILFKTTIGNIASSKIKKLTN